MSAYYGLGLGLGGAPVPIRGSHIAVGGLIEQNLYLQPDGASLYFQPDGSSLYLQP